MSCSLRFPYENYFVRLWVSAYQMHLMSFFFSRMGVLKHCSVLQACFNLHISTARVNTRKENDKWVKLLWEKGQFFSLDSCKLKPIRRLATSSQWNISHHLLLHKLALLPNLNGQNFGYKHESSFTVSLLWHVTEVAYMEMIGLLVIIWISKWPTSGKQRSLSCLGHR